MKNHSGVPLLQLSCREASRLASEALDRDLTGRERWALRIHSWLCYACRRFAAQLRLLRRTIAKMPADWRREWGDQAIRLSADRRETIKRLLADARGTDAQS